jgi:hypothetical protein
MDLPTATVVVLVMCALIMLMQCQESFREKLTMVRNKATPTENYQGAENYQGYGLVDGMQKTTRPSETMFHDQLLRDSSHLNVKTGGVYANYYQGLQSPASAMSPLPDTYLNPVVQSSKAPSYWQGNPINTLRKNPSNMSNRVVIS